MTNLITKAKDFYTGHKKLVVVLGILFLILLPQLTTSNYVRGVLARIIVYATIASGLNIINGYSGQSCLGIVGFTCFGAWLYRIAYRTALDMLRAAKRAANYPTPQPLEQDPGISDELRAALNALSPLDRALMLERVLDGMDYAALARIHGLPAPYLRTRYSRAKAKLAAILKEGEHDDL